VLIEVLTKPNHCRRIFSELDPKIAIELTHLLQYLGIVSEEFNQHSLMLLESLMAYCLLPKISRNSFAVVLTIVDGNRCSSNFWLKAAEFVCEYFCGNSK